MQIPRASPDLAAHDKRVAFLTEMRTARQAISLPNLLAAPLTFLRHFFWIVIEFIGSIGRSLWAQKALVAALMAVASAVAAAYLNEGAHTSTLKVVESHLYFVVWWVGLGVASSIGLGMLSMLFASTHFRLIPSIG